MRLAELPRKLAFGANTTAISCLPSSSVIDAEVASP